MNNTGLERSTYSVNGLCTNCGHKGIVTLPKGTEMPDKTMCSNCGCATFVVQKYFGGAA